MKKLLSLLLIVVLSSIGITIVGCGKMPLKRFYVLKYIPDEIPDRQSQVPYPYTIRIRDFDIENVYEGSRLVYSTSAYELQYDHFRLWAVKPAKMITDLVASHLTKAGLVYHVTRRLDEGAVPQYEISGMIESIEEFSSTDDWYAHLALTINLRDLRSGQIIYTRAFDKRKKVFKHDPELVVRALSELTDFIISNSLSDIDGLLNAEWRAQQSTQSEEPQL